MTVSNAARPDDPRDDAQRANAELAATGALLETASAQARTAAAALESVNLQLPAAEHRAALARGSVIAAEARAQTAERVAQAAQQVWNEANRRHESAATQVQGARDRLSRFAVAGYQGSQVAQFNALLGARAPADLVTRTGYLETIAGSKQRAVDQLVQVRRDARQSAYEAYQARAAADQALRIAQVSLSAAQTARAEADQAQRELTDLIGQRNAALAAAEAERADVMRRYEEVKRHSEVIAAELRAWEEREAAAAAAAAAAAQNPPPNSVPGNVGSPPLLRPGAQLLMPTRGWKSSDYGSRYDPYYHVWQLHAGVDIAAGGGEAIYAAAGGKVASAGWMGGYGNYTCIYHQDSMSTCYAHQSRILVSTGQWVARGQLIGRVGTTGASTGNHLHFEVRINGSPKDPLGWLPACLC